MGIAVNRYVVGVDPDSKAHGVALYCVDEHGKFKLIELKTMPLMELIHYIKPLRVDGVVLHIEDTTRNNANFRGGKNARIEKDIGRRIGKVQQAQIELERACDWYKIPVVKHPISSNWKKDKELFKNRTGWGGRSNEDTRSAAYFGWLGVTSR